MEEKLINIEIESVVRLFKKKFWIIILITAMTTSLGLYKASQMKPYYQARAKIFVGKSDNLMDYYSQQEIQYYTNFINTFKEIITIDDFLNGTLKKHNIDKTAGEVRGGLGFASAENSPIFTVSYSSSNNEGIEELLTAICNEISEQAADIMPGTSARIIDSVKISTIMPTKNKIIVVTFAMGIILSIGLILVLDYLDDRILSKEELEKILPIPVLGDIPEHEKEFVRSEKKNASNK